MSDNVAIVIPPIPSNDKEAWQEIDALIDAEGKPPEVFRTNWMTGLLRKLKTLINGHCVLGRKS